MDVAAHLLPVLAVADPRDGDGLPQAAVFWISVVVLLATFVLAFEGRLTGENAVFSTGAALVFGYWMRGETERLRSP